MSFPRFSPPHEPTVGRADIPARRLGDFPVARGNTGLESPVNRQAGKPAPHRGSWSQCAPNLPWGLSMNLKVGRVTPCAPRLGNRQTVRRELFMNPSEDMLTQGRQAEK